MERKIELLAPGGDIDSIKSAILAGADAVYCGLSKFNARNRAANISFEDLQGILRLAHQHHCKVFITLNIIVFDSEIPALMKLLNRLVNTSIDGVIVQDMGLFYILKNYFKSLEVHASTQVTTHNEGQIKFLHKLNVNRVNLSRELNIDEIKALTAAALEYQVSTEVFVHGSYCLSFSGICYMSAQNGTNSGNRGRCSQPCRDRYMRTPAGKEFPLNLKDNSAFFNLRELYDAGVASLKIEGRIKEFEYVFTVVKAWREQLDKFYRTNIVGNDNSALHTVFNRSFSNGFLMDQISGDMFIDNPKSAVNKYLEEKSKGLSDNARAQVRETFYQNKERVRAYVRKYTANFSTTKIPLEIEISGKCGAPLKILLKSPTAQFVVYSKAKLVDNGTEPLNERILLTRLKAIDRSDFFIQKIAFSTNEKLFLPYKELTALKKRVLFILNDCKEIIPPVVLPVLAKETTQTPTLAVLISSIKDIDACIDSEVDFYFQLPGAFKSQKTELVALFNQNETLIPWFPSILIGEDYHAAIEFLEELQPKRIVTNNTGVGYEAYKKGIPWVAGPSLNIANSYSLISLKENFDCCGAFLSNEMSRGQIWQIRKPKNFCLYYTIYQPVELMTSRQCLFRQVTGCEKQTTDQNCLLQCEKNATIDNMKGERFLVEKTRGNYHRIFSNNHTINTDIARDAPNCFSSFFLDLSDVKTNTESIDKTILISLFKSHISGDDRATKQLETIVCPIQTK
ncbi:MAG: peptidase U32 family protein [Salinivirgaceae bacterium]